MTLDHFCRYMKQNIFIILSICARGYDERDICYFCYVRRGGTIDDAPSIPKSIGREHFESRPLWAGVHNRPRKLYNWSRLYKITKWDSSRGPFFSTVMLNNSCARAYKYHTIFTECDGARNKAFVRVNSPTRKLLKWPYYYKISGKFPKLGICSTRGSLTPSGYTFANSPWMRFGCAKIRIFNESSRRNVSCEQWAEALVVTLHRRPSLCTPESSRWQCLRWPPLS